MQGADRKILIICPSMWPDRNTWGETQRMYYLACHLAENGWEVSTASPGFHKKYRSENRRQPYQAYFFGNGKSAGKNRTAQGSRKIFHRVIRRICAAVLIPAVRWMSNEPDWAAGIFMRIWVYRYQKQICRLIEDASIGMVLISAPAFALLRMGKKIRKDTPGVKIIYDYRDPWYLWHRKKNPAWLKEKECLAYADRIIGFSAAFTKDMCRIMGVNRKKTDTVYNGFSEKDWTDFERSFHSIQDAANQQRLYPADTGTKERQHPADTGNQQRLHPADTGTKKRLRLTYTGNVNLSDRKDNYRNLSALIQAARQCPDVEFYLVGVSGHMAGKKEKNIHYIGTVSQKESFWYMKMSDVLVSIHDTADFSGSYIISGKFYDYMRSGQVIWHIGSPQSLMAQMVRTYRLGICSSNKKAEVEEALDKLVRHWKKGDIKFLRDCNTRAISKFSREYQNQRYHAVLCACRK